ncbi:MAG: sensor histidine kinase [Bacteroidia bacterium]|nr:sensor histidine kinase [Bacteroidia bacterium]
MSEKTNTINYLIIGGTILMIILVGFMMSFIVLYLKRKASYKLMLKQMEIERQQELLNAIINTQEKERQYFARELHDSVGQMLSAIKLNINGIKRASKNHEEIDTIIAQSLTLTAQSIQEVRSISHSLLPGVLLDFGLKEALGQLLNNFRNNTLETVFIYEEDKRVIDAETELALFRISQELINNTIKYASATKIVLRVTVSHSGLTYMYEDNGKGFNPKDFAAGGKKKGLGLRNIESRVQMIGGSIDWISSAGNGLKVEIQVPENLKLQKEN